MTKPRDMRARHCARRWASGGGTRQAGEGGTPFLEEKGVPSLPPALIPSFPKRIFLWGRWGGVGACARVWAIFWGGAGAGVGARGPAQGGRGAVFWGAGVRCGVIARFGGRRSDFYGEHSASTRFHQQSGPSPEAP
jgi:hypothetical protein